MLVSSLKFCSYRPGLMDQPVYFTIKFVHVSCAIFSILGFTIQGLLVISNKVRLDGFIVKVLPHIIDTILLSSPITLVILSGQCPFLTPWITAKSVALSVYIGLGVCFPRLARTKLRQSYFFTLALINTSLQYSMPLTLAPSPCSTNNRTKYCAAYFQ